MKDNSAAGLNPTAKQQAEGWHQPEPVHGLREIENANR